MDIDMARGRILSRDIAYSEKLGECSRDEQWFYMRILPFSDDYGRLPGDIRKLKGMCFPYDDITKGEILTFLNTLHAKRLILFAENEVVEVVGFMSHQTIGHRRANSLFPAYQSVTGKGQKRSSENDTIADLSDQCEPALSSLPLENSKGNSGKTPYRKREYPDDFESFWSAFKSGRSKGSKVEAYKRFRKINPDEGFVKVMLDANRQEYESNPKYIKDVSAWLNQERWETETPGSVRSAKYEELK